jgi:hypothetical protein
MPPPREPIIRKKKKPKYNLPKSSAPRGDAGHNPKPPSRPKTRPAPAVQPGPYRASERAQVEEHKTTPSFRQAIRLGYKQRPVEDRQDRVAAIKAKPPSQRTAEDKAVMRTHRKRSARHKKLMVSQIMNDRQREIVEAFKRSKSFADTMREVSKDRRERLGNHYDPILFETDAEKLRKAGFKPPGTVERLMQLPGGVMASGAAVAEATYHDPIGVPLKTGKQGVAAVTAMPASIYNLATDPVDTVEEMAEGFADRSSQPYHERVKTIRDQGALDYAADAAILTGGGSMASKLLRPNATPRPEKRTSGGTATPQRASSGYVVRKAQNAKDRRQGARLERELQEAEAGGVPMDAVRREAALANRKAGRVVEVVARDRKATKTQRHSVAVHRGQGIAQLRAELNRRLGVARKEINRLSKSEKRAFYYAAAFGIRTAEQATDLLPSLAANIRAHRESHGIQVKGSLKKSDMLPEINAILAKPDTYFTPQLAEVLENLRPESLAIGAADPSLSARTRLIRRREPQADLLAVERMDGESDADYVSRVVEAATQRGLAAPLYVRSERYAGVRDFASYALGGRRAMARDKRYTGANLREGLQATDTEVYLTGLARNIKRRKNWGMVIDLVNEHAIKSLAPAQGMPLKVLRERAVAAGVDLSGIAFLNPVALRQVAQRHESGDDAGQRFDAPEETDSLAVLRGLAEATINGDELPSSQLMATRGWVAVPTEVLRELERQTTPSSAGARTYDILKSKTSRAMLLAGNVPWLAFSTVGNAGMAAVASGGRALNPANWLGAARWWREMKPEDREQVSSILGLAATGADSAQPKLGAASNRHLVNAYRAFKAHPVFHTGVAAGHGPSISQLNPMELMARADHGQNHITRIVAGYSLAKRDAVRQMGEGMSHADRLQGKITGVLAKPPAEQLAALMADRNLLEDYAENIADFMGDYTTLTATERRVVNRAVMFFPFVRYSLRLLFYVMPAKHPLVTAVLAELAELTVEEYRELFGDDSLPWQLGKIYVGENGDQSIDLRRAHPALNSLVEVLNAEQPSQLVGVLPPYAGWLYSQVASEDAFQGRDWRTHGKAALYGPRATDYGVGTRARILAGDMLSIFYPYRTASTLTTEGTQGDDSLLWDKRPTVFRGKTELSKAKAKAAKAAYEFDEEHESLVRELIPLLPQPDDSLDQAKRSERIAKLEDRPAGKSKRKSKQKPYFGGGGYFGAGG